MRYNGPSAEVREAFHQGTNRRAYEMLGAHPVEQEGKQLWHFAVWAPHARAVSLIGEFNDWNRDATPMVKQFDGTWEVRVPAERFNPASNPEKYNYPEAAERLTTYKYCVCDCDGKWRDKADPYGFAMENRPNTGSRIFDMATYQWKDAEWMEKRKTRDPFRSPMNIYELHLGSWKRRADGTFMNYLEIADELVPYIQDMGYTHVEFLPVMEHPLDMSWGYQVSGYYAATARFGDPDELMELIDRLHQAGIGVIIDWVPAHFPKDDIGLRRFDGTACYEHPDPRRGDMPQWGTHVFDFARGEVRSFLLSNACFWLEYYHADGLRVDAVSSMLYYDFCREPGEWIPNQYGGRENLDAISFLQLLNTTVGADFPGAITVAEESSAFPMVTHPTYLGGLGFHFKWNMGWMNDMLSYIEKDPIYRKWHHNKLTFSLMYAFYENYVLPFSHDEVVHGKHSMLDKQPGDLWKKFAGLRMLYGYTMAHPGKKLLFMGGEFGHFIEWKFDDQLDWFLLAYEGHPQVQKCVRRLNEIYRTMPAFYEADDGWDGFQWIQANDSDHSITAFTRTDKSGKSILAVTNFTPTFYPQYRIGLPYGGTLTEFFNTDSAEFGGSNQYNAFPIQAVEEQMQEHPFSCDICVPPMSTVYFEYDKIIPPPAKPKRTRRKIDSGHGAAAPDALEAPLVKPKRTRKKAEPAAEAAIETVAAPVEEKPKRTRKKAEPKAEAAAEEKPVKKTRAKKAAEAPAGEEAPAEKPKRTRKKKAEESAE